MSKTRYVVGFLFDDADGERVVLIRKTHPERQAGLLNGIGGIIGQGESPSEAMNRKAWEEAGIENADWTIFHIRRCGYEIYFFHAIEDGFDEAATTNGSLEEVVKVFTNDLRYGVVSDLEWLIPMALDDDEPGVKYKDVK